MTLATGNVDAASPWAILPIKSMQSAKQRLRTILTAPERQSLFRAMVSDVLAAIGQSTGLGGLAIVTRDPSVRSLARHADARFIQCDLDQGQSLAVATAARTLEAEGVTRMVTIPGDARKKQRAADARRSSAGSVSRHRCLLRCGRVPEARRQYCVADLSTGQRHRPSSSVTYASILPRRALPAGPRALELTIEMTGTGH